jgi:hypothetical protein
MISLLIMKRKGIHPMEWKISFHRMNDFYISLLTMKSSIAFGTVHGQQDYFVWSDYVPQTPKFVFESLGSFWTRHILFVCEAILLSVFLFAKEKHYFDKTLPCKAKIRWCKLYSSFDRKTEILFTEKILYVQFLWT